MDKLAAMRSFVSVVQNGGFSGAARALGVPKSRVSQRVSDLEAALATRLLQRTTRAVSTTEEGRFYYERCLVILEEIDAADQAMHRGGEEPSGRLTVSAMSGVARALLLPKIADFSARYPKVSLRLSVTDRLANLTEEGIDCAIRGGALENSTMISRHLRDVGFALYAAPGYLLGRPPIQAPEDLAAHELIQVIRQRGGAGGWRLGNGEREAVVDQIARLETDDDDAALAAAVAGAGIALCPDFAVQGPVAQGKLVPVLPGWAAPSRPVYLVYPTRRYVSARLRCFIDWASAAIRATPGG